MGRRRAAREAKLKAMESNGERALDKSAGRADKLVSPGDYNDAATLAPDHDGSWRDAARLSCLDHSLGKSMNQSQNGDDGADQRRSAALIGLIIILGLAIAGVVLVRELRERSHIEDCLMAGRTNCAPIETPMRH